MKPETSEYIIQCNVFAWALKNEKKYPELWLLNGSQNGMFSTPRYKKLARRAGLKLGYPDIFLPVARGAHHGLYIELKWGDNISSKDQDLWKENLSRQGYLCMVCWDGISATTLIMAYLNNFEDIK